MTESVIALEELIESTEQQAENMQREMVKRSLEINPKLSVSMTVDDALGALHEANPQKASVARQSTRGFSNRKVTKPLMLSSMRVFIDGLGQRFEQEKRQIQKQRDELDRREEDVRIACKNDLLHYLAVVQPFNGVVTASDVAVECDPLLRTIGVTKRDLIDALKGNP